MNFNWSSWPLVLHQREPLVQTAAQSHKTRAVFLPVCGTFANPIASLASAVSRRGGASRVFHGGAEQRREALRAHRRSAGQGRAELPGGAVQGESTQGQITPCHVLLFLDPKSVQRGFILFSPPFSCLPRGRWRASAALHRVPSSPATTLPTSWPGAAILALRRPTCSSLRASVRNNSLISPIYIS